MESNKHEGHAKPQINLNFCMPLQTLIFADFISKKFHIHKIRFI